MVADMETKNEPKMETELEIVESTKRDAEAMEEVKSETEMPSLKKLKAETSSDDEEEASTKEEEEMQDNKVGEEEQKMTKKEEKSDEKAKKTRQANKKVNKDLQNKILAYMGEQLQIGKKEVTKKDVATQLGTLPGSHGFFYSWKDLEQEQKMISKVSGSRFCLTEEGEKNIPEGVVIESVRKDNAGIQQLFFERLLKACKEARKESLKIIFDKLADGKAHSVEEFTKATGLKNLKTKALGYPLSHMRKTMKILTRPEKDTFQFTDECFPEGRPE